MIALILATLCAALFSILFKIFKQKSVDSMPAIVYNYLTAVVLSLLFSYNNGSEVINPVRTDWFVPALITGLFFILGLIALSVSTARVGVAVSTVSSRASMIIPILLNYMLIPGSEKPQWIAITVMLFAMFLIVWKRRDETVVGSTKGVAWDIIIPLSVFFLFGLCNAFLKLVQYSISSNLNLTDNAVNSQLSMVTFTIFISASFIGLLFVVFDKQYYLGMMLKMKNLLGGIALGASNFFCTYLLMIAMKSINAEILFPVHNVGIVAIGAIAGWGFYHEKMKPHQIIGFLIAVISICFL
ncbi:MAG: EamA family transporter [Bacteroidaceae bacterium]|nr:EamA family transporter [Bacteroidaceae bacterium]